MKNLIKIIALLFVTVVFQSFSTRKITVQTRANMTINQIDGKQLFISNGCTACHANTENSIGPKITDIAKAYKGKKEQLIKFFKKESKPIVVPEDYAIMAANLFITKKMSNQERSALADYILNIK